MKTEFRESFLKDLRSIKDKRVLAKIKETIHSVESADIPDDITHLKKIHGARGYFRIRIGDYRIGLKLAGDTFFFVRFMNRKEIYRYFP
ncbi:MAG: type II toxin-antitoxin system RelE/ParE family toxin [Pyrinomonadaceae bacterium]